MHKTAAILSYIYLSIPRNTGTAVPTYGTVPASTVGISGYNQKKNIVRAKIMLGINLITRVPF
jgi:hypothetical protein